MEQQTSDVKSLANRICQALEKEARSRDELICETGLSGENVATGLRYLKYQVWPKRIEMAELKNPNPYAEEKTVEKYFLTNEGKKTVKRSPPEIVNNHKAIATLRIAGKIGGSLKINSDGEIILNGALGVVYKYIKDSFPITVRKIINNTGLGESEVYRCCDILFKQKKLVTYEELFSKEVGKHIRHYSPTELPHVKAMKQKETPAPPKTVVAATAKEFVSPSAPTEQATPEPIVPQQDLTLIIRDLLTRYEWTDIMLATMGEVETKLKNAKKLEDFLSGINT